MNAAQYGSPEKNTQDRHQTAFPFATLRGGFAVGAEPRRLFGRKVISVSVVLP